MAVTKKLVGGLTLVLEVSDFLIDGQRDPRQFFRADTCAFGEIPDVLVKLFNAKVFGELLQEAERRCRA